MRNLILFLSLFAVLTSYSQITIYPENTFSVGDLAVIANVPEAPPGFDPGPAGPDQVWDFSGFVMDSSFNIQFVDPDDTPFGDEYPESNMALNRMSYLDSMFMYTLKNDTIYQFMGLVGQFEQYNHVIAHVTPPQTSIRFPVNYMDSIHELSVMEFKTDPDQPGVDSVWVKIWFDSFVLVDAWGEMITPVGSYDVLRIKSTYLRTDSTWILTNGNWEFYEADEGARIEWDFMSNTEEYPVVEFASDISGTYFGWFSYLIDFISATGVEEQALQLDLEVFPVPADDLLNFRWNNNLTGKIVIYDIFGRTFIKKEFKDSQGIRIITSDIANGSYFYSIDFSGDMLPGSGKIIIR